jgi:hypothetical protein
MYTSAHGDVDLSPSRTSSWAGWILFAAVAMVVSGIFDIIWGIVGIVRDEVFISGPKGNVVDLDYTTWGWINLILGIVLVVAGIALFTGSIVAMILAVVLAVLSAVENLLVIGAYPLWSVIVIGIDLIVIYAICVHGAEFQNARSEST